MKKVMLGNTGIKVSIAGFGVLPMGPSQLALPVEEGAKIIKYAYQHGINFIDTAQYYRAYPYISKALEDGGMDDFIICSKSLSDDYDGMMEASKVCHAAEKGIFSMKAFGGGSLSAKNQDALDYVFSQPESDSAMIGFGKITEVDDLLSYLDGTMDKNYNPDVSKKKVHINHEDCEGCGSCKAACPAGAIYWGENGLAEVAHDKCLTCGYCRPV